MATVISPAFGKVRLPVWVTDLVAFRRWMRSRGTAGRLARALHQREVWVDFITEEAQTHNFVKNAFYATLEPLTSG